jgi:hypothetical protein
MACRHHETLKYRVQANRLILAWLNDVRPDDHDCTTVCDMISTEIGDCPGCWRDIALYLSGLSMEYLTGRIAIQDGCVDEMLNAEKAAAITEARLARALVG